MDWWNRGLQGMIFVRAGVRSEAARQAAPEPTIRRAVPRGNGAHSAGALWFSIRMVAPLVLLFRTH